MTDQSQRADRKFCNGCGALNEALDATCARCGADLPAETVAARADAPLADPGVDEDEVDAPDPSPAERPPLPRRSWARPLAFVLAIGFVVGCIVPLVLAQTRTSPREGYLEELDAAGLRTTFKTDDDAVDHAKDVCAFLDGGGARRGSAADRIAVDHYCDRFLERFQVLEPQTIHGTVVLRDDGPAAADQQTQTSCRGRGTASDVRGGGTVAVRSPSGGILGTARLDPGVPAAGTCTFRFLVDLTPGQTAYLLAIGTRKPTAFTWRDLLNGPELRYQA